MKQQVFFETSLVISYLTVLPKGGKDCGLYSIAISILLSLNFDPATKAVNLIQENMRTHLVPNLT